MNRSPVPTETDLRLAGELRTMANLARLEKSMPLFSPMRPLLRYLDHLDAVAQDTVHHMIDTGYYGHVDLDGKRVGDRLLAAGFALKWHTENVGFVAPHLAGAAFERFMASKVHRDAILNPHYVYVGIGTGTCLEQAVFRNTKDNVTTTLGPSGRLWVMVFYTGPTA